MSLPAVPAVPDVAAPPVRLLTGEETATGAGQPWHLLRYEHTVRIRTMLTDQGWSAAYVNRRGAQDLSR
ncbi:hypothetical protein ACQEVF_41240 [Nonomuraea polychroma]|uniref:hypothetical protein n=1 Tax=Nonomuraea polychroma TaxID=46176 RepID=UPI003D8A08E4